MTQAGIDKLKEQLGGLKELMDQKRKEEKKPAAMSENQRQIQALKNEILELRKGLDVTVDDHVNDQMIHDCIENDYEQEIEGLKMKLKIKNAENAELLQNLCNAMSSKSKKKFGKK